MMDIHNDLARFVEALEPLSTKARAETLAMAALETGGNFKTPRPDDTWDNQQVVIRAHGISATGSDLAEVIRNWTAAARRQATAQQQLARADLLIRQPPGTVDRAELRAACDLMLTEARTAFQLTTARNILARMGAAT